MSQSHRLLCLRLDELEYAKTRIAMYNELPTKTQLLQFIFEVESRIDDLEYASIRECAACGWIPGEEDDE